MRLFGKIDSAFNRFDRAQWLTVPFDLSLVAVFGGISLTTGLTDATPSTVGLTDAGPLSIRLTDNVSAAIRIRE